MWEKFPPMHMSCDTAHKQWLQTHRQWYLWLMSQLIKSRMNSRKIFKLGEGVDHVTHHDH